MKAMDENTPVKRPQDRERKWTASSFVPYFSPAMAAMPLRLAKDHGDQHKGAAERVRLRRRRAPQAKPLAEKRSCRRKSAFSVSPKAAARIHPMIMPMKVDAADKPVVNRIDDPWITMGETAGERLLPMPALPSRHPRSSFMMLALILQHHEQNQHAVDDGCKALPVRMSPLTARAMTKAPPSSMPISRLVRRRAATCPRTEPRKP